MLKSFQQVKNLSRTYGINEEDILLIALNASGLRSNLNHSRIRFHLRLRERPEERFNIIVPVREDSPFQLKEDGIWFDDHRIADIENLENDDAVLSYFRNGTKVLTVNSNARSACVGCTFCCTGLQDESDPHLNALDDLQQYLSLVRDTLGWTDLSSLDTLAVCTGCFHYEDRAIDHLAQFRNLLHQYRSKANIHFLSSVIRSKEGFERIQREVSPFHLTLTIECLSKRNIILKDSKASLTYEKMIEVLDLGCNC